MSFFLDLITRIIFGEEQSSLSSSLRGLLQSPLISSHLPLISSSEPYFQTPSVYIPPPITENNKNRKIKLNSLIVKIPFICEVLSADSGNVMESSLLEYDVV
jgi:hypothetical protein